ncbi:uncharacterized protein LOC143215804 isoform X2 [Lasioglossum baleicum]|uniref:uncharacterized protein LOC143215804 isoform X2 n=1 Tax=Lasioglossum baleicum TaxID=434251 RepID=UPI003FCDA756
MAMTMPLAPSDMFPEPLHQIQLVADRTCGTFPIVLLVMAYLRNVWLPISSKVSVSGSPVRTNNIVESFNNTLAQRFQTTRPNLWIFLDNLLKQIKDETTDYERLLKNLKVTRIRTRANRERIANIKLFQDNLVSGIPPIGQFLKMFNKDYGPHHYVYKSSDSGAYNGTCFSGTFSTDRLLEYTTNGDLCTRYVKVKSTTVSDMDETALLQVIEGYWSI